MGTPIAPDTSLDEFINSRRRVLEIVNSLNVEESRGIENTPKRDGPSFSRSLDILQYEIGRFIPDAVKEGYSNFQERTQEKIEERGEPVSLSPGILEHVAPAGGVKNFGVVAKSLIPRTKGAVLAEKIPAAANKVGVSVGKVYEKGVKLWSKSLSGPNPGRLSRTISELNPIEQVQLREGMLEGLREHLMNMPKLTKEAQANLLSPAGRARLRATLADMPQEAFDDFMRLLERGKHVEWRNRAFVIALVYPSLRFAGAPIWKALTGQ